MGVYPSWTLIDRTPLKRASQMPDKLTLSGVYGGLDLALLNPFPPPAPITGPPLSLADQVRQAARSRNTQRDLPRSLGTASAAWALERGARPAGGAGGRSSADYLVHLAEEGRRMATIRQARAAVVRGAELAAGFALPELMAAGRLEIA